MTANIYIIISREEEIIQAQKSFKIRYVLHYGEINTAINPEIVNAMLGPSLTKTRSLREDLKLCRGEQIILETGTRILTIC